MTIKISELVIFYILSRYSQCPKARATRPFQIIFFRGRCTSSCSPSKHPCLGPFWFTWHSRLCCPRFLSRSEGPFALPVVQVSGFLAIGRPPSPASSLYFCAANEPTCPTPNRVARIGAPTRKFIHFTNHPDCPHPTPPPHPACSLAFQRPPFLRNYVTPSKIPVSDHRAARQIPP